jgi:hypothetical protein
MLMANGLSPLGMTFEDVEDVCEVLVRTGRAVPRHQWDVPKDATRFRSR